MRPHSHDEVGRCSICAWGAALLDFSDDDGDDGDVVEELKVFVSCAFRPLTKSRCSLRPMKRARTNESRTKTATMESRIVDDEGSADRVRSTSFIDRDILGIGGICGMDAGKRTLRSIAGNDCLNSKAPVAVQDDNQQQTAFEP